jgi:hypothetical protein
MVFTAGRQIAAGVAERAAAEAAGEVAFGATARIAAGQAARTSGWQTVGAGVGTYLVSVGRDMTGQLLQAQSGWEVLGRLTPGVATGFAIHDAYKACNQ